MEEKMFRGGRSCLGTQFLFQFFFEELETETNPRLVGKRNCWSCTQAARSAGSRQLWPQRTQSSQRPHLPGATSHTTVPALTWLVTTRHALPAQLAPAVVSPRVDGAAAQQQQRVALPAGRLSQVGAPRWCQALQPAGAGAPAEVHPATEPGRLLGSGCSVSTGSQKLVTGSRMSQSHPGLTLRWTALAPYVIRTPPR